jgi:hypothetical protein
MLLLVMVVWFVQIESLSSRSIPQESPWLGKQLRWIGGENTALRRHGRQIGRDRRNGSSGDGGDEHRKRFMLGFV